MNDKAIASHYAHGSLMTAIRQALVASGKDLAGLTPRDLAPIDEFHIGGHQATAELFAQVEIAPGAQWLDIGSGLGGPARHLAVAKGYQVSGIDLTEEYVAVATELARLVGLETQVTFRQGSALALPYPDGSFAGASLLHVGMNISDKAALCAGVRRVLKPGGTFAIFDVMRAGDGALDFPVPWAASSETSFVATPGEYRAALEAAGFTVLAERDRTAFALAFFDALRARAAQGQSALGLHIVMGEDTPRKIANMIGNLRRGLLAPVEILARA